MTMDIIVEGTIINLEVSRVDRLDYSNDTATASVKGTLLSANQQGHSAATGNQSYGYFAGGQNPSLRSRVDRIDYSNDTATATQKGPLTVQNIRWEQLVMPLMDTLLAVDI